MAFDLVEPFGERPADLRGAMIAGAIHNRMRGKDESSHELSEFQLIKPDIDVDEDEETIWGRVMSALLPWRKKD